MIHTIHHYHYHNLPYIIEIRRMLIYSPFDDVGVVPTPPLKLGTSIRCSNLLFKNGASRILRAASKSPGAGERLGWSLVPQLEKLCLTLAVFFVHSYNPQSFFFSISVLPACCLLFLSISLKNDMCILSSTNPFKH